MGQGYSWIIKKYRKGVFYFESFSQLKFCNNQLSVHCNGSACVVPPIFLVLSMHGGWVRDQLYKIVFGSLECFFFTVP